MTAYLIRRRSSVRSKQTSFHIKINFFVFVYFFDDSCAGKPDDCIRK